MITLYKKKFNQILLLIWVSKMTSEKKEYMIKSHKIKKKAYNSLINEDFISKEHIFDIINFLPDPTFVINSAGHVIAWNHAMEDLTHVKAVNMMGKGNYEYAIPFYGKRRPMLIDIALTSSEDFTELYDNIWRDESSITAEIFIPSLNGKPTYLWGKATNIYNKVGVLIGSIESIRDITEKKIAELELVSYRDHLEDLVEKRTKELETINLELKLEVKKRKKVSDRLKTSKEIYRNIFENTGTATLIIQEDDSISMVNTEFEKFSGYPKKEILGKSWRKLILEDDLERLIKYRKARLTDPNSAPSQYEFRYKKRDGEIGDAYMTISKLLGTNQYIASVLDITSRKKVEKEINNLNKRLKLSNAELEQFAYIVSHDLQEPLRIISSFTKLLERDYKGELDDTADEFIYFIIDGVQRMQQLINDLLEYSRVKSVTAEHEHADLEKILKTALKNLQLSLEENNAQVTYDPLPKAVVNQSMIGQVFQNLISNAIKYRTKHNPEIHISCREKEQEFVISVKDNGIGISPENLQSIFTIFKRLHSQDEYEGTGIGLAITKKIIDQHGGRIWAESKVDAGSTFYFTLPK